MKSLTLSERFRLWIALSEGPALWVAILGTIVVVGGITALIAYYRSPTGPAVDQNAVVISMGNSLSETGNEPRAAVRLADGAVASVTLDRTHQCRIGDTVTISVEPQRWGISRSIYRRGCNS